MVEVKAIMAGNVWKIEVQKGDEVKEGDVLIILESMKMEIPIEATEDGFVEEILVVEEDFVQEEQVLVKLTPQ